MVEEADLTILCNFPVGPANERNLELAGHARRLVILQDGPQEQPRLFFSENAESLFSTLTAKAEQMEYGHLCEALDSGQLFL
jgi:iron complex transport system ATP-binding protein